jgi:1,4-dihydroxy-2-naphthoyl-CoA hydrolase
MRGALQKPSCVEIKGGIMRVQGQIDFTITERSDERVVAEMPIIAGIKNPFGTVHAGAILWFADVAATVLAMNSDTASEGMKGFPLAISLNANLLGNQKEGAFQAVSSYVKKGRAVSVVRTVVSGADGKLIADVTTSHVLSQ